MDRVAPWTQLSSETLLDCGVFDVERNTARSPKDGSSHVFYRLRAPDWVHVVPVTANDEIVMIRQYRHGSGVITLEIPGGMLDPGEGPQATARRECLEETGYRASSLASLGEINPNPALFANRLHSFYAENVERVADIQNTSTEQTEVVLVPIDHLRSMLRRDAIDHGLVAGTLWRFLCERS